MTKELNKNKVIFMGTSTFADIILNALIEEKYNISGVYTQPDKKAGRNREIQKSPVKITAEKNGIEIFQPEKFDDNSISELKQQKPDLIIVASYGKILPKKVLEIPEFGCINIHASLLPEFRGPSPVHNTLLFGKNETGTTIMLMKEGIDTGDILAQEKINIHSNELFPELLGRLASVSALLLLETIPKWINGEIVPEKQDDSKATACQIIEKDHGHILWSDESKEIYDKYRAFYTWPGVFSFWEREGLRNRIKLNKISLIKNNSEKERHLGEVFKIGEKIGVQTMSGVIILEELQLEGKGNMKIENFINGYPNFVGSILK